MCLLLPSHHITLTAHWSLSLVLQKSHIFEYRELYNALFVLSLLVSLCWLDSLFLALFASTAAAAAAVCMVYSSSSTSSWLSPIKPRSTDHRGHATPHHHTIASVTANLSMGCVHLCVLSFGCFCSAKRRFQCAVRSRPRNHTYLPLTAIDRLPTLHRAMQVLSQCWATLHTIERFTRSAMRYSLSLRIPKESSPFEYWLSQRPHIKRVKCDDSPAAARTTAVHTILFAS